MLMFDSEGDESLSTRGRLFPLVVAGEGDEVVAGGEGCCSGRLGSTKAFASVPAGGTDEEFSEYRLLRSEFCAFSRSVKSMDPPREYCGPGEEEEGPSGIRDPVVCRPTPGGGQTGGTLLVEEKELPRLENFCNSSPFRIF